MVNRTRQAFTLAELMIVVAILALLVAIILPVFHEAIAVQRKAQCARNLYSIGEACGARSAKLEQGVTGQVAPFGWQDALSPLLSYSTDVFYCPEDDDPAPDPTGGLKGVCIECYHRGSFLWDVYLDQADSDQWIWKMSGTQYRDFMKVSGEGVTTPYKATYVKTGYLPDSDPYTMYFTFEDTAPWGGGDQDFYDVVLKVHYTESEIHFEVMVRASGMTFNVCKKDPDREVLIANPRVGNTAKLPFFGGRTSYGLNSMSTQILSTKKKLLALDYEYSVAIGSNLDRGTARARHLDYWYPDPADPLVPPTFARHFNKCNVLFADGSVELMSLQDINPNDPDNVAKLWDP